MYLHVVLGIIKIQNKCFIRSQGEKRKEKEVEGMIDQINKLVKFISRLQQVINIF